MLIIFIVLFAYKAYKLLAGLGVLMISDGIIIMNVP